MKARNLAEQGELGAEEEFRAAIDRNPSQTQVRLALADFYLAKSRYQDALAACLQELELDLYSNAAKLRLGHIYLELRDPQKGLAYLQEGLKGIPEDANAHADLARVYELLDQPEQAVGEYLRALKLDSTLNRVHYVLARIYRQLGKQDLARSEQAVFRENEAREQREQVESFQQLKRIPDLGRVVH